MAKYSTILSLLLALLCSCSNYKDIPYFQNSAQFDGSQGAFLYDMTIKPKDRLNIFVFAEDEKLAAEFNLRERMALRPGQQRVGEAARQGGFYHYLVSAEGNINYPLIGNIHVGGLTIEQAANEVRNQLLPYFKIPESLVVNVRLDNYYVSVLGEVKSPGSFDVTRNKITVLEALAMAGDMTIYGKRNNVKVLRELPNGEYEIHELDLRDANILNSPYYYLQQRDILYVEPNEAMAQNAKLGRTRQLWVRGISISIALGSLLYRVIK